MTKSRTPESRRERALVRRYFRACNALVEAESNTTGDYTIDEIESLRVDVEKASTALASVPGYNNGVSKKVA